MDYQNHTTLKVLFPVPDVVRVAQVKKKQERVTITLKISKVCTHLVT